MNKKIKLLPLILLISSCAGSSKPFSKELGDFINGFNFETASNTYLRCEMVSNARKFNRETDETIDTCVTTQIYDKQDSDNLYYYYESVSTGDLINDLDQYGRSVIEIQKQDDKYVKTVTHNSDVESFEVTLTDVVTAINDVLYKTTGTYNLKSSGLYYGDMISGLNNYQQLLSVNSDKTILTYNLENALLEKVNVYNLKVNVDQLGMVLDRNISIFNLNDPIKYENVSTYTYVISNN